MISFIIPNRGGKNIEFVCKKLRDMYGDKCEYIVVTQADDRPFARGQLFNIGYKYSTKEYLCFIDNDMFFPEYIDLEKAYEEGKHKALQPFVTIAQIKITGKETYIETSKAKKKDGAKGGVTFISRENFEKANGMSNLYLGWGREDNEFDCRVNKITDIPGCVCHITHPLRVNTNAYNTQKNREYYASRGKRDFKKDGYKDTIFDVVSNTTKDGIKYIAIKNIRVKGNFPYKGLFDKHFKRAVK